MRPFTSLIRYQTVPDFEPAQSVLQLEPRTEPTTVTFALVASLVFVVAVVEGLVRRLTPAQAGTIGRVAASTGPGATASVASSIAATRAATRAARPEPSRGARARPRGARGWTVRG